MATVDPWLLAWESPYETHEYHPLYLATGRLGGQVDLSGVTMDLWSVETGGLNLDADPPEDILWPVTALRVQAFYRRPGDPVWVGRTGIHTGDSRYTSHPGMPHLPQVYGCRQSLDLAKGVATTTGTMTVGAYPAWAAGSGSRVVPFESRIVALKDSTLMAFDIRSDSDVEICFSPELVLEEQVHAEISGKGILRWGTPYSCRIRTRQALGHVDERRDSIAYRVQPEGGVPYVVRVTVPGGRRAEVAGRGGFACTGRLTAFVQFEPGRDPRLEPVPDSFDELRREQERRWARFWSASEVRLPLSESLWQQRYHASLFQVAQSLGPGPSQPGGLTRPMVPYWFGCFHDTDTYFCRSMLASGHESEALPHLRYRHSILARAREHAAERGFPGALYPWQSDLRGNGEVRNLPLAGAIIAVEAGMQAGYSGSGEARELAGAIVAEVLRYLLEFLDLGAKPLALKPVRVATFSETMDDESSPELLVGILGVARSYLDLAGADGPLGALASRVLSELRPERDSSRESYLLGGTAEPAYLRCPSLTLGSFPLESLEPDAVLGRTFDKELSRVQFHFAWIPHQASIVASRLGRSAGPAGAAEILRHADTFYRPWHAFDEWENRRTTRCGYYVTSAGGFALAIQHLLLAETARGVWRLFPAVPGDWHDVSFRDLRIPAGWRVSAALVQGRLDSWSAEPAHGRAQPVIIELPDGTRSSLVPPGAH